MASGVKTCPKYVISYFRNSYISSCNLRFPFASTLKKIPATVGPLSGMSTIYLCRPNTRDNAYFRVVAKYHSASITGWTRIMTVLGISCIWLSISCSQSCR